MKKLGIVTDSTVTITKEEQEKYDIHVIPLSVHFGNEVYLAGEEMTTEEFYERIARREGYAKTSQPSLGLFIERFDKLLEEYEDLIFIGLTSHFSGTVQTATLASQEFNGRVTVVDSLWISFNMKHMCFEACRMRDEGKSIPEIVERIDELKREENGFLYLIVEDFQSMHHGGRVSKSQALLGSLLKIKPIIQMNTEGMHVATKARTKKKALDTLVKYLEDFKPSERTKITIIHSNSDSAGIMMDRLTELFPQCEIEEGPVTPVIGAHTGLNALGILAINI